MLHCTNCGTELPANAMLCPKCGTAVGASPPLTEARAIHIFIGDKHDYFTGKWAAMSAAGKQTSWNWPAFLVTLLWFPYRKMYLYTGITIGGIFIESVGEMVLDVPDSVSRILSITIGVTAALLGNQFYRMHVEKHVRQVLARRLPEAETIAELTRQGGTNVLAAIAVPVLFIAAMFGLGALSAILGVPV